MQKNIVITGSTRGIGKALCMQFLQKGHRVLINGRNEKKLEQVVGDLKAEGYNVCGCAGDVSKAETHTKIIEEAQKCFGHVDIWINNAGIPQPWQLVSDVSDVDIENIININIKGLIYGSRAAINLFSQQGHGKLFNMEGFGSDGRIMPKLTLYGTTKRAVNYFTKSLAGEFERAPFQVGILSPGMVRTDFINIDKSLQTPEEQKQQAKVYRILAEDPETVAKVLVKGVLSSTKSYDRINFLNFKRLLPKLIRLMLAR